MFLFVILCDRSSDQTNKRRKAGGNYLTSEELRETLLDAYQSALDGAGLEAFEGRYEAEEIDQMIDRHFILDQAIQLILQDN